jgi:hypothetical protein
MKNCLLTVCGSILLIASMAHASAGEVWFAPPDNLDRGARTFNHDFPQLFESSPAWDGKTDVFVLSPKFAEEAPEEATKHVTAWLAARHIALAVGAGTVQTDNAQHVEGECGYGVEGYSRPNKNQIIFSRLKRRGVDVQYVAMDEPLTFGYFYHRKNACNYTIGQVSQRVARTIAEIRQAYPNAKMVDYEAVVFDQGTGPWLSALAQWLAAYRAATGEMPYALVFDLDWTKPWQDAVQRGTALLHKNGVRAGIILDGTGPGQSDAGAVAAYKRNMASVAALHAPLDFVEIANWTPHPASDLPQSDPNSLTGVLHYYNTTYHTSTRN